MYEWAAHLTRRPDVNRASARSTSDDMAIRRPGTGARHWWWTLPRAKSNRVETSRAGASRRRRDSIPRSQATAKDTSHPEATRAIVTVATCCTLTPLPNSIVPYCATLGWSCRRMDEQAKAPAGRNFHDPASVTLAPLGALGSLLCNACALPVGKSQRGRKQPGGRRIFTFKSAGVACVGTPLEDLHQGTGCVARAHIHRLAPRQTRFTAENPR